MDIVENSDKIKTNLAMYNNSINELLTNRISEFPGALEMLENGLKGWFLIPSNYLDTLNTLEWILFNKNGQVVELNGK